jgi:hypothetical protein
MFGWFHRKQQPHESAAPAGTEPLPSADMVWCEASLPIPDWARLQGPPGGEPEALHALANRQAAAWLDALGAALDPKYRRHECEHFMVLSPLDARAAKVLMDYLERSRKRVLATLPGIAAEDGHGKTAVLVMDDQDDYYAYVSNYTEGAGQEQGLSGGMFIDAGYGHFVFAESHFDAMEAVVVHELTHALVRHLPLPAWLNEGLAVNTERRFVRAVPRYQPQQLAWSFGEFWNDETIQEFWSGKSFLRSDEGQPLSYELARVLVELVAREPGVLQRFCAEADRRDAGEAAALAVLGTDLQGLAGAVLGEGEWMPRPAAWVDGIEVGSFRV